MGRAIKSVLVAAMIACLSPLCSNSQLLDLRGAQFIAFDSFSDFKQSPGTNSDEVQLISQLIQARISWNELIVSWNVELPTNAYLKIEARAIYPDHATKFYTMGLWSADPSLHPRESVNSQKDEDGDVLTDTLALDQPAESLRLRVTLGNSRSRDTNGWGEAIDEPET